MTRLRQITPAQLLIVLAVIALPAWIGITGIAHRVWSGGTMQIILDETLYVQSPVVHTNPDTTRYVYLPTFAILNALVYTVPIAIVHVLGGWSLWTFEQTLGYAITAGWGYGGYLLLVWVTGQFFDDDRQLLAMALMAACPLMVVHALIRGADLLVAALFLLTVLWVDRDQWFEAGIAVSLSTLKFTGVPILAIFSVRAFVENTERRMHAFLGVFIGQLPNLYYFLSRPGDLLMILRERGAISTDAYRIRPHETFLLPLRWTDSIEWYAHTVFPIILITFTVIGIYLAFRIGLLPGFAVGYTAMSVFIPAENRLLPLLALLLVMLVKIRDRWAIGAAVTLLVFQGYALAFRYLPTKFFSPWNTLQLRIQQLHWVVVIVVLIAVIVSFAKQTPSRALLQEDAI